MYEAVDAGIPILGFPIFYDQPRNIANLVEIGMALKMDLYTVTKDTLFDAITELINNETYDKLLCLFKAHLLKKIIQLNSFDTCYFCF